jgi:RimJ/RimL family protein N-acetyltransferase
MNLHLERLSHYHFSPIFKAVNENREISHIRGDLDYESQSEWIQRMMDSDRDDVFVAMERDTGEYVGHIGIHELYIPAGRGRLGMFIKKRGKGHGKAMLIKLLDRVFAEGMEVCGIHINKIWAINFSNNTVSKRMLEGCGFQVVGVCLDEYLDSYGKYHDMIRREITKSMYSEWCCIDGAGDE